MMKCLKSIDIYPQQFVFTYKGRKTKTTVWGGAISIITVIALLIVGLIIGKDIYLKHNPLVVVYEKTEESSPIIRFNNHSVKLGFSMSKDIKFLWDESIVKVTPIYYIQAQKNNNKTLFKEYFLDIEDCVREEKDTIFYQKCIKNFDIYLGGSWSDNYLTSFSLKFTRCTNSTFEPKTNIETEEDKIFFENFEKDFAEKYHHSQTHNFKEDHHDHSDLDLYSYLRDLEKNKKKKKITCKTNEEIDKVLENNYWLNIYNQYVQSQPRNFKKPLIKYSELDYYIFGKGYFKYIDIFFQSYGLATDKGLIFEDIIFDSYQFGVGRVNPDFTLKEQTELLMQVNYLTSKKHLVIARSYIKLQTIFANLGGFINITLLFFNFISLPFFKIKMNLKGINEFFELVKDKDEKFKKFDIKKFAELIKDNQTKRKSNEENQNMINNNNNINARSLELSNIIDGLKKNNNTMVNKDMIEDNHIKNPINKQEIDIHVKGDIDISNNRMLEIEKKKKIDEGALKKIKKKLRFERMEIIKSSYGCICNDKKLEEKYEIYSKAAKEVYKITDFLQLVKMNKEFKVLKYLLLNSFQQKTLDFTNNLLLEKDGYEYQNEYISDILKSGEDDLKVLEMIKNYFVDKNKNDTMTEIDKKLFAIIDNDLKGYFIE